MLFKKMYREDNSSELNDNIFRAILGLFHYENNTACN